MIVSVKIPKKGNSSIKYRSYEFDSVRIELNCGQKQISSSSGNRPEQKCE